MEGKDDQADDSVLSGKERSLPDAAPCEQKR